MPRTLTPDALDLTAMRSLVVVKPSSLGDIVHTLPAVALIKRAHPQLSIRWVVRTEFMALLDGNPDLDGLIEFPRRAMRGPLGVIKLFGWARRTLRSPAAPDLLIDFQGLARSAVMAKRSGARILWLTDLMCEGDVCATNSGKIPLYRDRGHLSIKGSRRVLANAELW